MTTIIEVQEEKLQCLSEYAEKVLRYGGKLMQCIDEMENKSKYHEYRGHDRKRHDRGPWDEEPIIPRYY